MRFIADLHIHSHYSIATSRQLTPEYLEYWACRKGITVTGTGDFTHPGWLDELQMKLEPAEPGLFRLRDQYVVPETASRNLRNAGQEHAGWAEVCATGVRFMLTAEISTIYKMDGAVRKVHHVIWAPDFASVQRIQHRLEQMGGNIRSDGRPILGLDSRNLLEICLECSPDIFFFPAHIWTPWFSVMGSRSGFDSVEECFRDLSGHIHAVETGLSTDPPMHWMCRSLDRFTLLSNSDAHSPEKLGRNANIFNTDLDYFAMVAAVRSGDPDRFHGTIDLFPQEGKYHYDGHRKCGVRWDPVETLRHGQICPRCGKPVTVGVMSRVVELSDRVQLQERPNRMPFHSIIPLKEILSEIHGVGPASRRIDTIYTGLLNTLGPELYILMDAPLTAVSAAAGPFLAVALERMRAQRVHVVEGFDGEYGHITVFSRGEPERVSQPSGLFPAPEGLTPPTPRKMLNFSLDTYRRLRAEMAGDERETPPSGAGLPLFDGSPEPDTGLHPDQQAAAARTVLKKE